MRKRRWLLPGCLAFWLLVSAIVGFVIVMRENSNGVGSMDAAMKLRPLVEAMPEPEVVDANRNADAVACRFSNGEWVVGVARNSHGPFCDFRGGGTVVLKDSRGRVRCFFGHVCGDGGLGLYEWGSSLKEFDAKLAERKFAEQKWP